MERDVTDRLPRPPARREHAPTAAEHPLLRLQSRAGNGAVRALAQRQPATADAPATATDAPLDDTEAAAAVQFHTAQPWFYNAQVIGDIRGVVGVPGTGVDVDLVQAIAVWQRDNGSNDPALNVDGKAGPRTMARMFPTGLNRPGEGEQFAQDAQAAAIDEWDHLGTAQARADALVREVNKRLADAGVPAVTVRLYDGDSPEEAGAFDFGPWVMNLNRRLLELNGLDQAGASDLVNTVYHEARHTEQWFRMARLRAGMGVAAAAIATEMGIPNRIAAAARATPLRPGTSEGVIAQGWWDSVYGDNAGHREVVLTRISAADWAVKTADCRCRRNPTPENQAALDAARARFAALHEQYRDLPEENDAWATGPMAGHAVTSGTPNPQAVPEEDPCEQLRRAGRPVPGGPAAAPQLPANPSASAEPASSGTPVEAAEASGAETAGAATSTAGAAEASAAPEAASGELTDAGAAAAPVEEPQVTPPTFDGPLHGNLPEDGLA